MTTRTPAFYHVTTGQPDLNTQNSQGCSSWLFHAGQRAVPPSLGKGRAEGGSWRVCGQQKLRSQEYIFSLIFVYVAGSGWGEVVRVGEWGVFLVLGQDLVPGPGIEPGSLALESRLLITGAPGYPPQGYFWWLLRLWESLFAGRDHRARPRRQD